jgi:putative transposase
MSHSLTKIWIHAVWSTKERCPYMSDEILKKITQHIKKKIIEQKCAVKAINGMEDHIHCLFLLNMNISLKEIMMNVKGETSHWINESGFYKEKFEWQAGYGAFSVSESVLHKIENYIINQKGHHKEMEFKKEWELLIGKHHLGV